MNLIFVLYCNHLQMSRKLDYNEGTIFIRKTDLATVHSQRRQTHAEAEERPSPPSSVSEALANHERGFAGETIRVDHTLDENVVDDIRCSESDLPLSIIGQEEAEEEDDDDADALYEPELSISSRATRSGRIHSENEVGKGGHARKRKAAVVGRRATVMLGGTRRSKRLKGKIKGKGKADEVIKVTIGKRDTVKDLKVKVGDIFVITRNL